MKKIFDIFKTPLVVSGYMFLLGLMFSTMLTLLIGIVDGIALSLLVYILGLSMFVMFVYLVFNRYFHIDYELYKNAKTREYNGEKIPLGTKIKGYHWFKGYLTGAFYSLFLVVMIVITEILGPDFYVSGNLIMSLTYGCNIWLMKIIDSTVSAAWLLLSIPMNMLIFGIPYHILGMRAKKIDLAFEQAKYYERKNKV